MFVYSFKISAVLDVYFFKPDSLHFMQNLIIFRWKLLKVLRSGWLPTATPYKVKTNTNNKHPHFYMWAVRQLISS